MLWKSIAQRWISSVAQQRLRAAAADAARNDADEPLEKPRNGSPPPQEVRPAQRGTCDVAVIFSLGIEAGGFEDRLAGLLAVKGPPVRIRQGGLHGRNVVTVMSGLGQDAAKCAASIVISGHRPRWVISTGFAGGLDSALGRGDILMADSVANSAGQRLTINVRVDTEALSQSAGVHVGRLLTLDRIIRTPDLKRSLGAEHEAAAVDMETFAVAEVCQQERVRCLAIRVISDGVDDELPEDIDRLVRARTNMRRLGTLTGTVLRRPSSVKDMWRLKEVAITASDRLAKFLDGVIAQLPP